MALIKSWDVLPHLSIGVNNGIEYLKEIQFEERATDPSDANLADGRVYHQTGVGFRVYEAGSWITVGSGGSGSTTFVGLTDTPSAFTSAGNKLVKVNTGATALEFVTVSGDVTMGATGIFAIASGVIINDDIKSDAAIAVTKLAVGTTTQVLLMNSTTPTWTTLTGDVTVGATGTTAIGSKVIVNDDIADAAAITSTKMALATGSILVGASSVATALDAKADGKILVGNASTITSVAVSGDCTLANDGAMTVTDLTIASEAAGDILYFNGANWIRLAKPGASDLYLEGGTTPAWTAVSAGIASNLSQSVTAEAGTNDYTIAFTTLTSGASTLTIPDMAGAAGTFAFINKVQTWTTNQTIAYGHLLLGDSDDGQTLQILVNENMTGNHTLTYLPNDGDRSISLTGNVVFSANVTTTGTGTLTIACGVANRAVTLAGDVTLSGALLTVGDDSVTFTTGGATDVTLPTTGTLATLTGTEALSGKTLTTPKIVTTGYIADAGGDAYLTFVENAAPTDSIQITQGASGGGATISAITSETNANLILDAAGTGDVVIANGTELTFARATQSALIVVADQTGEAHTFNIPDIATGASDTFAFLAEAQALTNKTIDADSNTITNINANELDPVGNAAYGIPFLYRVDITDVDGDTTVVSNSAFKFRVIDAWSVNTSGNGGVWSLKTDTGKMTDDVTVAANDTDIDRPTQILDNMDEVAATTGDLYITSDATLDATVYVLCLRID